MLVQAGYAELVGPLPLNSAEQIASCPPPKTATLGQSSALSEIWAAAPRPCSSATGGTRFSATEVAYSVLLAVLDGAVHMVGQSEPQMHLILSA
jgi:hypothetical protein